MTQGNRYEVVHMFDGTWNVRDNATGEWVREAVHFGSKLDATAATDQLNAAAPSREGTP